MNKMVGLMDDQYKFPIGSRIKVNDDFGTVKYVGNVQGYNGIWLGIEWDNFSRGKHDGTINGIYYFSTKYPTSGSMIRIHKIEKFESLQEAVRKKYLCDEKNPLDKKLIREAQKQLHANVFEIVGMEKIAQKQSKVEELNEISVSNSPINCAGDLHNFKRLSGLNISSTLIWNWNIVSDIAKQVPSLEDINLSSNRFTLPKEDEINRLEPSFRNIKQIVLGKFGIKNWDDLITIAHLWPNIESLGLQENYFSNISTIDNNVIFRNLKKLDLNQTNLSDFNEILKLGNINSLEVLLLMENNIEFIKLPECDPEKKINIFENLKEINLLHNPIKDEASTFNELDKLKSLSSVCKTSDKKSGFDEMFSMAVGLISNLQFLNRTFIERESRKGAEYDIWKKYGEEWQQCEGDEKKKLDFTKKYRNYGNLLKKYGSPAEFLIKPQKKLSNLIKIKIQYKPSGELWEKKLLRKLSLNTLQGLIMKQFKLKSTPKMTYIDIDHKNLVVELNNMSKTLDFYSIKDNDLIIVE
ncbi:tubulin-specific chaperone E [Condylostylus longicornis]|uniref:tubulin-specific chaperone E n=1 Tax=Condylostylus longicornis TaxID=2530218 RepID=UPI00244DDCBE|nr:tubulin-specific chaperone E [Condylostylus longicornis]